MPPSLLSMRAYVVVDATAVESSHATVCCGRVVIFDKSVVEAL